MEPWRLLKTAKFSATAVLIGSWVELNIIMALPFAPLAYEYSSPFLP